jgi:cyclophilin family peptidyl-prolyl cis-trans isomerase
MAELFAGMKGDRPRELLVEMLEDEDGRVRGAALRSLRLVAPETAASVSIRHLAGSDPFERVAAAETLAAAGSKEAFAPLEQAFLAEKDSDPRIRASLLKALSTLDPEKARPTATGALEDPSHFLRKAAASILARGGVEASVRPRSSELGLDDYQASLAAPFSPQAFITTSRGRIEIELFIADAPQTVSNFIRLARDGFFTGNRFYEVAPNGHVATGDPRGDGRGGPGYVIRSELNERPVVRGTLAMVEEERDSGGSRFLITHLPEPALEGRLTVFGLVTAGMEVVDRLEPQDVIEAVTIWDGVTSPYER